MFSALNKNVQTYFREAVEKYEVKVYELSLICEDSVHTFNFWCRVELGIESVYYDAEWESKNMSWLDEEIVLYTPRKEKLTTEIVGEIQTNLKENFMDQKSPSFQATMKVNKKDPLQKEYSSNEEEAYNRDIKMSYLKFINVPTISDLNYKDSQPDRNSLTLDYIDHISYEIEQQELEAEKDKIKMTKVDRLFEALKSIHVYLHVGETSVIFSKRLVANYL